MWVTVERAIALLIGRIKRWSIAICASLISDRLASGAGPMSGYREFPILICSLSDLSAAYDPFTSSASQRQYKAASQLHSGCGAFESPLPDL